MNTYITFQSLTFHKPYRHISTGSMFTTTTTTAYRAYKCTYVQLLILTTSIKALSIPHFWRNLSPWGREKNQFGYMVLARGYHHSSVGVRTYNSSIMRRTSYLFNHLRTLTCSFSLWQAHTTFPFSALLLLHNLDHHPEKQGTHDYQNQQLSPHQIQE